jgi:hypothetical protein
MELSLVDSSCEHLHHEKPGTSTVTVPQLAKSLALAAE